MLRRNTGGVQVAEEVVENRDVFRRAPKHELVGVFEGEDVRLAVDELLSAGHNARDIDLFHGEGGLEVLDRFGEHHGLRGRLIRGLQQLGSEEANIITFANALGHGRSVVGVRSEKLDEALVEVFIRHHATDVVYFGAFSAWTLGDS
jgi:hypothetical protein